jgi:hypothetical protein
MEPEDLLPCSQETPNAPYIKQDQFSSYYRTLFLPHQS